MQEEEKKKSARIEINDIRDSTEKIMCWLFEHIKEILNHLTKKTREKTQTGSFGPQRDVTTEPTMLEG